MNFYDNAKIIEKNIIFVPLMEIDKNSNKMTSTKKIKSALISVYHKDNLDQIVLKLHAEGVKIISTGGTQQFIESLGVPCVSVESMTAYPSIFGGRVKTLHPLVFGAILNRRDNEGD